MFEARKENTSKGGRGVALARRAWMPALAALTLVGAHVAAKAMEQATSADVGTVWWSELRTREPQKTQEFYSSVFGWTPKVVAEADSERAPSAGEKPYTMFSMGGKDVAGAEEIGPDDTSDMKPGWLNYVQVADVDAAARKALEHGGKIIQLPFDVPSVGRIAEIEDPEGNRVGLVAPSK